MRKIAIIAPCVLPVPAVKGGAVEELVTGLIEENEVKKLCEIDVFTIDDDYRKYKDLVFTNIITIKTTMFSAFIDKISDKIYRRVYNSSSRRVLDLDIINAFLSQFEDAEYNYSAVIVENIASTAVRIAECCREKFNFPIYFHMHNDVDVYRSPQDIRRLVDYGVQFIAVSNYIRGRILECASDAIVHVLYNGINLANYDNGNLICKRNGEDFHFLYAGRIIPAKGVIELVGAFNKLLEIIPESERRKLHLDIIGFSDGKYSLYEKRVIKEAKKYNANISCKNRIATSDMAKVYSVYDAVVMPTISEEPFGLVALEAMAVGKPLITTNSGAIPEIVGDCAAIVDKNVDFESKLTSVMMKVISDQEYRNELAIKAHVRALSNPDFDIGNYYRNACNIFLSEEQSPLISVIVPVYNVATILQRCVDSLLAQSYKNTEIILVDDGSNDDSGRICDDYAAGDSRIKVVHQKNMGLPGARNTGIDVSSGEFIFFCDSDDTIMPDTLNYLLNTSFAFNADIVACGFSHVNEDYYCGAGEEKIFTSQYPGVWSGRKSVIEMMRNNNVCTVAWNKLYKKELFKDIRFTDIKCHEDEATIYKLLYRAGIVVYTPKSFYKYYQRNGSIMRDGIEKRYKFLLDAFRNRIDYFAAKGDEELCEHSRISLLEGIKYAYRNVDNEIEKSQLSKMYAENIDFFNSPVVYGLRKKIALWIWKYVKY